MSFLTVILERIREQADHPFLLEATPDGLVATNGRQLTESVARARAALRELGLQAGDRCALLHPNSTAWVAIDLAMLAEGLLTVPLYARQKPAEMARILEDCLPSVLICDDAELAGTVRENLEAPPRVVTTAELLAERPLPDAPE
ncbi:MAG: AMP-binding protein, partial [Gemmatimonadetes bacterium]|nr:AMP-binding protein [Gemmatimonadota bacterium]